MGEWYVNVEATCTTDGESRRDCSRCTYFETEVIASSGHKFTTYTSDGNATCTADGTKTAKCENCTVTDTVADTGSALGHDMGNWYESVEATCTTDGESRRDCSRCSHFETEKVKASGHTDTDADGRCDSCSLDLFGDCTCSCHKTGFIGFIWKIINFFNKLFKSNRLCRCGILHY